MYIFFTVSKFYKNLVKWAFTEMECSVAGTTTLDREWNSPCDKNASAALWKREPISDDDLPSMRKAVLSISSNV